MQAMDWQARRMDLMAELAALTPDVEAAPDENDKKCQP